MGGGLLVNVEKKVVFLIICGTVGTRNIQK